MGLSLFPPDAATIMSGMGRSKWIRLKSPREKVYRVAARMFRSRLEAITHYLPLAVKKTGDNTEYVHQLRIWTRRADAVLDLCSDLLSKRHRRKLQSQLDMLRDASGAARDADVMREQIAAIKPCFGRDHLLKEVEHRRRAAQAPMTQANEELGGGRETLKLSTTIGERIRESRRKKAFSNRFTKWSRARLFSLVKRFLKRGKAELSQPAQLHKFRIAGKRLRYALELVGGALEKSRRKDAYQFLDRLQQQLGSLNDSHNLILEIERALAATKKRTLQTQLRRLLTVERRSMAAAQEIWAQAWSGKKARRMEKMLKRLIR